MDLEHLYHSYIEQSESDLGYKMFFVYGFRFGFMGIIKMDAYIKRIFILTYKWQTLRKKMSTIETII